MYHKNGFYKNIKEHRFIINIRNVSWAPNLHDFWCDTKNWKLNFAIITGLNHIL